jgi:hypothetical protein
VAAIGQIASHSSNKETVMPSRGKKKTTMAKLNREARLRERRSEKQARKVARRDAAATESHSGLPPTESHSGLPPAESHSGLPPTEDHDSPPRPE